LRQGIKSGRLFRILCCFRSIAFSFVSLGQSKKVLRVLLVRLLKFRDRYIEILFFQGNQTGTFMNLF
jgi:hypothetical protein